MLTADSPAELDQALDQAMKPIRPCDGRSHTACDGSANPAPYLAASLAYNLRDGVAEQITSPTLICEAEDGSSSRGSRRSSTIIPRDADPFHEEGAGAHCQAGAGRLAFARIDDWLEGTPQ
jgi:hypothetical protein